MPEPFDFEEPTTRRLARMGEANCPGPSWLSRFSATFVAVFLGSLLSGCVLWNSTVKPDINRTAEGVRRDIPKAHEIRPRTVDEILRGR